VSRNYCKRYFSRELARKRGPLGQALGLNREQVMQVLDAYHDEMWRVLLAEKTVTLGCVGRIRLAVRAPSTQPIATLGGELVDLPQTISLRGKASNALKQAYYDLRGVVYPDDLEN
jgi:nucleoid DNA-binding protein